MKANKRKNAKMAKSPVALIRRGSRLVAKPAVPQPTLTCEDVRTVLERVRDRTR